MRHQTSIVVADPTNWMREVLRVYVQSPSAPSTARTLSLHFPADVIVEVGTRVYLTYRDGVLVRAARFTDHFIPREDGEDAEEQLTVRLLEESEPQFLEVYSPSGL